MEENVFPIQPTFITRIKQYELDDQDGLNDFDLNHHGIFGIDYTQGFLAVIAHEKFVNAPVTLYEFLPNSLRYFPDLLKMEENNQIRVPLINTKSFLKNYLDDRFIIRTDNVNHFNIKKCCDCFRSFLKNNEDPNGIHFCEEYDLRISLLAVKELSEDNFKDKLLPIIDDFNKDKSVDKIFFVERIVGNRPFIYYQCPISGFYEAIFPIFHKSRVVGCIMIGEIVHEKLNVKIVTQKFKSFLGNEHGFNIDLKKIENSIKIDFSNYIPDKKTNIQKYYCTKYSLEEDIHFRESIEKHLINIERRIRKRVGHISQRYVSTNFLKIKDEFEKNAFTRNSINKLDVSALSKIIENALEKIIEKFPNEDGFIRIFMSDTSGNDKILKIIAASDRKKLIERDIKPEDYTYDLTVIDKEIIEKNRNVSNDDSDEDKILVSGKLKTLENGIRYKGNEETPDHLKGKNIIRYYPTLAKNVYFIIWKRYANDFKDNNTQFDLFKASMFDFYRTIAANYAALWGSQVKKLQEDAIRITAHETNQVIPVIVDSLEDNFKNDLRIDDVLNQLELLKLGQTIHSFAFKNIDFIKYPKTDVDIKALINRFGNNFYKKKLNFRTLHLKLEPENIENITIHGNYVLIEHALNNLIDNAVKYCYWGTNIIIQFETLLNTNSLVIHIKSCGPIVPSQPNVFDLYTRGEAANYIEGNGIGLFLCKKIIEAHGWNVDFTSNKKSDYNIACVASFIQFPNTYKISDEKFLKLSKEFKGSDIEKYVCKDNNKNFKYFPLPTTFLNEYIQKTYLNDFFITIKNR